MDGQSAASQRVELELDADQVRIFEPNGTLLDTWPIASLQMEVTPDGRVVHLRPAAGDASVTSSDPSLAVALSPAQGRLTPVSNRIPLYVVALACVIAGLYLAVPYFSRFVAHQIPFEYEAHLGPQLDVFLKDDTCSRPDGKEALAKLVQRLSAGKFVSDLRVVNVPIENAFTLPGGKIVLTRALIEQAKSSDEIAGVLAHEVRHVAERHLMTQLVRSSILTGLWGLAVGDFSGLMVLDPSTVAKLTDLRFSRQEEAEADSGGLKMLDDAGISRAGLRNFFERIRGKTDVIPEFLSSHPTSANRVAAMADADERTTPALDEASWQALQSSCQDLPQSGRTIREILLGKKKLQR